MPRITSYNVCYTKLLRSLVNDTGVLDKSFAGSLSYDFGPTAALSLRLSHYEADNGGFGYVSPEDLGDPSGATIRILYPTQKVNRATATSYNFV